MARIWRGSNTFRFNRKGLAEFHSRSPTSFRRHERTTYLKMSVAAAWWSQGDKYSFLESGKPVRAI